MDMLDSILQLAWKVMQVISLHYCPLFALLVIAFA